MSRLSFSAVLLLLLPLASAAPFLPTSDAVVLERLPSAIIQNRARLAELRSQNPPDPQNPQRALDRARSYIETARRESDPRFLGYAESALDSLWQNATPPAAAFVLRATIRQSRHQFEPALSDLDRALAREPRNPSALLLKSTILQVLGRYSEARHLSLALWSTAPELASVSAAANLASLTGQAEAGYSLLCQCLARSANAGIELRVWAESLAGEIAERLGDRSAAEQHYRQALALNPNHTYTLAAYSDFLLAQHQPAAVLRLLNSKQNIDALLLRIALAESQLPSVTPLPSRKADMLFASSARKADLLSALTHRHQLQQRFEANLQRGDFSHGRERARFLLELQHDPAAALSAAAANWQVQREPADALIFLQSALAADAPFQAAPVLAWLRINHVQDVRFQSLLPNHRPPTSGHHVPISSSPAIQPPERTSFNRSTTTANLMSK